MARRAPPQRPGPAGSGPDPQHAAATAAAARRPPLRLLAALGIALLLAMAGLRLLLQPERVVRLSLEQTGRALGLDITASGLGEYRLGGTPTLVARDLVARAPGAATPVLTAERVRISLPWETLRGRVRELDFTRLEFDAPVLDLAALRDWRATRPPGPTRLLSLSDGLRVQDGRVVSSGWQVRDLVLDAPAVHPGRRTAGTASGRFVAGATQVPFATRFTLLRTGARTPLGVAGTATVERPAWRMPAELVLGGMLEIEPDAWGIAGMRLRADAQYQAEGLRAPFGLGLAAPLRHVDGRLSLAPAGVALRPRPMPGAGRDDNPLPELDAGGALALQDGLELQFEGALARWPRAWPALPRPLRDSRAPLPFALHYAGPTSLADPAELELRRDRARFDGRLRLHELTAWMDEDGRLSPLPPLDGTATLPVLEIAGATLHGVELTIDDPDLPGRDPGPADRDD
jgi:hypothetical protein